MSERDPYPITGPIVRTLSCWLGAHVWRWYSLHDPGELRSTVHVSQCLNCGRIAGGWRGGESQ